MPEELGHAYAVVSLEQDQFNKGLTTSMGAMKGWHGNILKYAKITLGIAGVATVIKGLKAAFQASVEFDTQLRNVWTLTTLSWQEMQRVGEQVDALAPKFGKTGTEGVKALYQIYSAGHKGAAGMQVLEASLVGATAGLTDVFTWADVTTTVLNAYKMSAEKAAYVTDVLFKVVERGKVTGQELASTFGPLAAIAAPMGASFEEVSGALMTLTRQGISADRAVVAITQSIMQLARPTEVAEQVIKALGFESGVTMVAQLGFAEALKQVTDYAKEYNIELTELFTNKRAILAVLPLAGASAAEYAEDIQAAADATGAATTAFEKQQGPAFELAQAHAELEKAMRQVGTEIVKLIPLATTFLEGFVSPLIEGIGDLLSWIAKALEDLADMGQEINDALVLLERGRFEEYLEKISPQGFIRYWLPPEIRKAIDEYRAKIEEAMEETSEEGEQTAHELTGAFTDLSATFKLLSEDIAQTSNELETLEETGKGVLEGLSDLSIAGIEVPELTIGGLPGLDLSLLRVLEEGVRDALTQAWEAVQSAIGDPDKLSEALEKLWTVVEKGSPTVQDLVAQVKELGEKEGANADILSFLHGKLVEGLDYYEALIPVLKFFGLSTEEAKAAAEYLATALNMAADEAKSFAERVSKMAWDEASKSFSEFEQLIEDFAGGLKKGEPATLEELSKMASEIESYSGAFSETLRAAWALWGPTVEDIESGKYDLSAVPEWVSKMQELLDRAKAEMEGLSPEQVANELERIEREQKQAAEKAAAEAKRAASLAAQAAKDAAREAQEAFKDMFEVPAREALITGDWTQAAQAIQEFALMRGDLVATAASLSQANDVIVTEAEVLQLIIGGQRTLLSTMDDLIAVMQLAGEDASALEDLRDSVELLLDPLKRLRYEIIAAILEKPTEAAREFRTAMGDILAGKEVRGGATALGVGTPLEGFSEATRAAEQAAVVAEEAFQAASGNVGALTSAVRQATAAVGGFCRACQGLPSYQAGGTVTKTGPALLHAGETVISANKYGIGNEGIAALMDYYEAIHEEMQVRRDALAILESWTEDMERLGFLDEAGRLQSAMIIFRAELEGLSPSLIALHDILAKHGGAMKDILSTVFPGAFSDVIASVIDFTAVLSDASTVSFARLGKSVDLLKEGCLECAINSFVMGGGLELVSAGLTVIEAVLQMGREAAERLAESFDGVYRYAIDLVGAFHNLVKESEDYAEIESAIATIRKGLLTVLLGFLAPIAALLKEITGLFEEEADTRKEYLRDLNVPIGWKAARFQYEASIAGQPPILEEEEEAGGIAAWLKEILEKFRDQIDAVLEPIRYFIEVVWEAWKSISEAVIGGILPVLQTFADVLRPIADWIRDVLAPDLEAFFTAFGEWWQTDVDPFLKSEVFPVLGGWFTALYTILKEDIIPLLQDKVWPFLRDDVWPVLEKAGGRVLELFQDFANWADEHWSDLEDLLINQLESALNGFIGKIEEAGAFVMAKSGDIMTALKTIWESESLSLWEKLRDTMGLSAIWLWEEIKKILSPAAEALGRVFGAVYSAIEPVVNLIGGGLMLALDAFGFAIKLVTYPISLLATVVHNAVEWIKDFGGLNPFYTPDYWELPKFQHGGIVPGPIGVPRLVVAEGGEQFTPPGQAAQPITINVHVGNERLGKAVLAQLKSINLMDTGFALEPMGI